MKLLSSMVVLLFLIGSTVKSEEEKQPVFLFCPHKESLSSLSLYAIVDKNDPKKLKGVGIEELVGQNSKDFTYSEVQKSQKNVDINRVHKGYLVVNDFKTQVLKYNDILEVAITDVNGEYKIALKARVGFDEYFKVGGEANLSRDMKLAYSYINKCWQAKTKMLTDITGENVASKFGRVLTGIRFIASTTMVSRIIAIDDCGESIMIMDR